MANPNPTTDEHLIHLYTVEHLTLRQIGKQVGLSGRRIGQRLQKNGITREQGTWVKRMCANCGNQLLVKRCRAKQNIRSFCGSDCYYELLRGPEDQPYIYSRNGSNIARDLVSRHFNLLPQHIVHHKDRDQAHNVLSNLAVFASHSQHMAHHRGINIQPIWDCGSL